MVPFNRHEFRHNHGEWINLVKPVLDSATSAQICGPLDASDEEIEICKSIKNELHAAVNSLLKVMIEICKSIKNVVIEVCYIDYTFVFNFIV